MEEAEELMQIDRMIIEAYRGSHWQLYEIAPKVGVAGGPFTTGMWGSVKFLTKKYGVSYMTMWSPAQTLEYKRHDYGFWFEVTWTSDMAVYYYNLRRQKEITNAVIRSRKEGLGCSPVLAAAFNDPNGAFTEIYDDQPVITALDFVNGKHVTIHTDRKEEVYRLYAGQFKHTRYYNVGEGLWDLKIMLYYSSEIGNSASFRNIYRQYWNSVKHFYVDRAIKQAIEVIGPMEALDIDFRVCYSYEY